MLLSELLQSTVGTVDERTPVRLNDVPT